MTKAHPVLLAFERFKNMYYSAVQTDTILSECDYNEHLEKKAKGFWEDADKAEHDFKELLLPFLDWD